VREICTLGSARRARSNARPYRNPQKGAGVGVVARGRFRFSVSSQSPKARLTLARYRRLS
jgi:nucleoid DNA-binding protein